VKRRKPSEVNDSLENAATTLPTPSTFYPTLFAQFAKKGGEHMRRINYVNDLAMLEEREREYEGGLPKGESFTFL